MRRIGTYSLIGAVVLSLALGVLLAGCGSDPTTSEEYKALEQQLAAVTAERDALAAAQTSSTASSTDVDPTAVPAEISKLIDNWSEALAREDGSVLELYVPEGYHLYGDQRIEHDSIPAHLFTPGYTHEWTTPTLLITNEGDGRYVAVRGTRNTSSLGSWASALLFEIMETPNDGLRLAQTAWFYDSEWTP